MDREMTHCPHCDAENIEGADSCAQCGQSLSDLGDLTPATNVERSLMSDRIGAIRPSKPVTAVSPDTTIGDVLGLLVERSIGCVLVTEDDQLVGIFSERDALLKLNTQYHESLDRPVSEFMTTTPQPLDAEAKVAFVVQRMDLGSYRHVPVTDADNRPVAIISARDILRYLNEKMTGAPA